MTASVLFAAARVLLAYGQQGVSSFSLLFAYGVLGIFAVNLVLRLSGVLEGTCTALLRVPFLLLTTAFACSCAIELLWLSVDAVSLPTFDVEVVGVLGVNVVFLGAYVLLPLGVLARLAVSWVSLFRSLVTETRASVLFLRPFAFDSREDEMAEPPTSAYNIIGTARLAWGCFRYISGLSSTMQSRLSAACAKTIGPVVVLGSPRSWFPGWGPITFYATTRRWRWAVTRLIKQCRCVVVSIGDSDGLDWELRCLREMASPSRVFLVLDNNQLTSTAEGWWVTHAAFGKIGIHVPAEFPGLRSLIAFDHLWRGRVIVSRAKAEAEYAEAIVCRLGTSESHPGRCVSEPS